MNTRVRTRLAAAAALLLVLSVPGAALAATDSHTVTETLNVQSQITLTGIPTSVDYGSKLAGQTSTVLVSDVAQVTTNHPSGWTLSLDASDLARLGGGGSIASTSRSFRVVQNASPAPAGVSVAPAFAGGTFVPYSGSLTVLASSSQATGSPTGNNFVIDTSLAIPAGAVPGDYTGTLVFTASTNP